MITDKEIQILKEMHFHGEISESEFERRMEQARTEEMEARENFMKAIVGNKEAPKTMTEQEAKLILNVRVSRFAHANDVNEALEVAISALEEIQQYRALGTVEELREAMEKQRAKKPYLSMNEISGMFVNYADGHGEYKVQTNNWWRCPFCNSVVGQRIVAGKHVYGQRKKKYCEDCGQAIDWSEEE